jgi:3-dehydrotetronate 4-kinase
LTKPVLGCIADDFTGATDLASMLVRSGMRVIQCFGIPRRKSLLDNCDAVVISLKSRSISGEESVRLSLQALQYLGELGIERFFFKYCSTFDSTPAGNIGPVADALAEALSVDQVLFCPAFPENGRTVYCGHLFVHGVPLHESSLRNHPLNPMTDSNLVRWLQQQSRRHVTKLDRDSIWHGSREITSETATHWIADAVDDGDLAELARLAADHRLLTGGSAIAEHWGKELLKIYRESEVAISEGNSRPKPSNSANRLLEPDGLADIDPSKDATDFSRSARDSDSSPRQLPRVIILAGSCSEATRQQIIEFEAHGPVYRLNGPSQDIDATVSEVLRWVEKHRHQPSLLISSSSAPEAVKAAKEEYGALQSATMIEDLMSEIALKLVNLGVERFVIAGGETSGAIVKRLGIEAVRIGSEIVPGVPCIQSLNPPFPCFALKSGNFGGPRFFLDAVDKL